MTQIKKIAYKGDGTAETGAKIIKALEDMGGVNEYKHTGQTDHYYYINYENDISCCGILRNRYTIAELPTEESVIEESVTITPEQGQRILDYYRENDKTENTYLIFALSWAYNIVSHKSVLVPAKTVDELKNALPSELFNEIFPKPFPPKGTMCIVWNNGPLSSWKYGDIGESDGNGNFIFMPNGGLFKCDNYHVLPNEVLPKN